MQTKKICKIICGGDGGTGKTTLITTKKDQHFPLSPPITIGVDFTCFPIEIDGVEITFLIYDLGGQKRFQFLHNSYLVGSRAGLILYDLTRESTFENLPFWYDLFLKENPNMPIIIAGSKLDLVQAEDVKYYLTQWQNLLYKIEHPENVLDHCFFSSKTQVGLDQLFIKLGSIILERDLWLEQPKVARLKSVMGSIPKHVPKTFH